MIWKYKVGDECIINSRYEGAQEVTVVSLVNYAGEPHYELDRLIQIDKSGDSVGSAEFIEHEEEYIFSECCDTPCPEGLLTLK